jgi:hypothetical protein
VRGGGGTASLPSAFVQYASLYYGYYFAAVHARLEAKIRALEACAAANCGSC